MIISVAAILVQSENGLPWPVYLMILVPGVAILLGAYWQFFAQWLRGVGGRKWPTVPAVIDLISVQKRVQSTGKGDIVAYVALLTYVYHNPDLQTGDYDKSFSDEDEAQDWASSFKGCTVLVHVNPRNPSRSVLRAEDLAAAVSQPASKREATTN